MQCPDCGAHIGEEDRFCGECGRPVPAGAAGTLAAPTDADTATVVASAPETAARAPHPTPVPSRPVAPVASKKPMANRGLVVTLLVLGAMVAVCVCGLVGFIVFQSADEMTPTSQAFTSPTSLPTGTSPATDSEGIPSPTPVPLVDGPLPTRSPSSAPTHVDEFEADDDWDVYDDGTTWAGYVDGGYRLGVLEANYVTWANPTWDESFANLEAEVDTRQVEGPIDNNLGLLVRYQPGDQDYYWFQISNDGFYSVSLLRDGEWSNLSEWEASSAIQTGLDVVNRIKVVCVGSQFDFYVNDVYLTTVVDNTFATGDVGLAAGTFDEPGIVIEFDNLTIRELDE